MNETDPLLYGESTELQDLDLLTFFDDFATQNNDNSNTTQPPSATLTEFEAQIQAMLDSNNVNNLGNSDQDQNFSNNAAQDFNNFQYSVPTSPDNPIFSSSDILAYSSPDSYLNSPNSYTIDDTSLSALSPSQFNNIQDYIMTSNDSIMQDSAPYSMEDSLFELNSKNDINLMSTQQVDKKRVNPAFDDSISPDTSLKKKRKALSGGIGKSIKRSPTGLKSSGSPTINLMEDETTSVPNILRNNSTTQSIIVPSSPSDLPSNFSTNAAMLTFNPGPWNQTINPSSASFSPNRIMDESSQFTSMPLLVRDGATSTAKVPINRLKSTITNTQPQQNIQSQPIKQQKKVAHNAIERRYRNNINDRINDLKNVVPALCHLKSKDKDDDDIEEVDGIPAATKLNKATILRKATEYITYLKSNNQKVKRENETLKNLIEALPGGVDLYNAYMADQQSEETSETQGAFHTPPPSNEISPDSSLPGSPDYNTPPTPPVAPRALMALFMCMTFFSSPSSYITQSHSTDHHHEGRVLTSSPTNGVEGNSLNVNDGVLTINLWYLARISIFLICLTYIVRPSLFSSQPRRSRKSNSIISSVLNSKTKDAKTLYRSLSSLSNGPPSNIIEIITGLVSESIKFSLRRLLGWDITSGYTHTDDETRLFEVALWGRMGEVELCGGNDKASRLSILYTCLHTINLLESPYTTKKYVYLSSSRIYANAALQSYIGLSSFPFLAEKFVAHFWKLANKEKVRETGTGEKWLEIALNCDHKSEMWKEIVKKINDALFEKSPIKLMKNITIPLTLVTDVQATIYLKQAFYNFISTKFGGSKKSSLLKNRQSFSFSELVRDTTSNSFTHWYALAGCCIEAFYLESEKLGENLNKLKDYPVLKNDYDKQIITMGLLSYALLMQGKIEASLRCANKTSIALTKRKEQRNGDDESFDGLNNYSFEIEQDIHYLTEFCVGWIVLEAKSLGWKIVEGLSSSMDASNNNTKQFVKEKNENENENANENTSTPTATTTVATPAKSNNISTPKNKLPNMLDSERLQSAITLWTRYLRRLSKNSVFEDISKIREIFIKKLIILENIAGGNYENSDDDFEYVDEDGENKQHNCNNIDNSNSQTLSESEFRATKAWSILKGNSFT